MTTMEPNSYETGWCIAVDARDGQGHQEGRAASCGTWSATAKAHSDDGVMPALLGLVRQGDRRPALGYEINRPGPSLS